MKDNRKGWWNRCPKTIFDCDEIEEIEELPIEIEDLEPSYK